jgi:hypothetical protein
VRSCDWDSFWSSVPCSILLPIRSERHALSRGTRRFGPRSFRAFGFGARSSLDGVSFGTRDC